MATTTRNLVRLRKVYSLVERSDAARVAEAAYAWRAAELLLESEDRRHDDAGSRWRQALGEVDTLAAKAAEADLMTARRLRLKLAELLVKLNDAKSSAQQIYNDSRLRLEQVEHVIDENLIVERAKEEKQLQGQADDRFLARRSWLRSQAARRGISATS